MFVLKEEKYPAIGERVLETELSGSIWPSAEGSWRPRLTRDSGHWRKGPGDRALFKYLAIDGRIVTKYPAFWRKGLGNRSSIA